MKNNTPLVSIIVPIFNCEKYLSDCIDSLLNQDYQNLEIILVNDGSTDKTQNICAEYTTKYRHIRALSQPNRGVSAARNLGIKNANGEFIYFIDADDTIRQNCISTYLKMMQKYNVDVCTTYKHQKFTKEPDNSPAKNIDEPKIISGKEAAKSILQYRITINPGNRLFKRAIIKKHRIRFNENVGFGEGFSFCVEYFSHSHKVAINNTPMYNYRTDNSQSAMTKFRPALIIDSLESQKYIANLPNLRDKDFDNSKKYALWHTCCDCLNTLYGTGAKSEYKKYLTKQTRRLAYTAFTVRVPIRDKLKAIAYLISPSITAKTINHFRIRKFTKE